MSFRISKIIDTLIKSLDKLIKTIDIAINSFYKLLDYLIKTFNQVSKKILNLFTNILRLIFYILPFIFMVIIGPQKDWKWMTVTGWAILILVMILFFRDFMAEIRGVSESEVEQKSVHSKRVFLIILILNIVLISYSVTYYLVGISAEKYISTLFSSTPLNKKADLIRETVYINILQSEKKYEHSQIVAAIKNLGNLKSQKAKPLLINILNDYNLKDMTFNNSNIEEINCLIEALEKIGGSDVCSTLVTFEINCENEELKNKARKAANKICRER